MMRVVHLTQSTTVEATGGLEYHIAYLADALERRGHEIFVVGLGSILVEHPPSARVLALKDFIESLSTRRLPLLPSVFRLPMEVLLETATMFGRRLFKSLYTARIVRHVDALKPDIVHQHSYLGSLAASRLLARKYPVVFTNHTGAYLHFDRWAPLRFLQRQVMKRFTMVIGPSRELVPASKNSRYIPNGADLREFHTITAAEQDRLKERHACSGKKVFLCPRRWAPTKGIIYLARALRLLSRETREDSVFFFAGNQTHGYSRYQANVHSAIKEATDCDVRILGNLDHKNLAELMNISEACIVPSLMEATSLACLEAMACGTPVIGARTGGLVELIQHEKSGWLVPPRDSAALAAAIENVAALPGVRRQAIRAAAHEAVRDHYTWEMVAEKTEEVYLAALRKWTHGERPPSSS